MIVGLILGLIFGLIFGLITGLAGSLVKMVKGKTILCSKEEMDKIIEASIEDDFYYMFFNVLKTTGRRLGELWGIQSMQEIGRKIIGKKVEYDEQGKEIALSKTRAVLKRIPKTYRFGVQVKDIDFNKNTMKVWVLKRREYVQDESVLIPEVARLVKHYILKNQLKEDDFLFRRYDYRTLQNGIKRFAEKAGIKHNVTIHNFRHYLVTELIRKDLLEILRVLEAAEEN